LSQDGASSATLEAFGIDAGASQFRLYDRQGKLRQTWNGEMEGIEEKIQELLAEES
jgi:hypothetical protein